MHCHCHRNPVFDNVRLMDAEKLVSLGSGFARDVPAPSARRAIWINSSSHVGGACVKIILHDLTRELRRNTAKFVKRSAAICLLILSESVFDIALAQQPGTSYTTASTPTHIERFDYEGACVWFDTAGLLNGAEYIPVVSSGGNSGSPGIIIQHTYAVLGASRSDFKNCKAMRYYYQLLPNGSLAERAISLEEKRQLLSTQAHHDYEEPAANYIDFQSKRDKEFSGCPFHVHWISTSSEGEGAEAADSHEFAIISIPSKSKMFPTPNALSDDLDRDFLDCTGWKARGEEKNYIVSHRLNHSDVMNIDERFAVESQTVPMVALINQNEKFSCFPSKDIFEMHLILRKDFFDVAMRDKLRELIKTSVAAAKPDRGPMAYIGKMEQSARAVADLFLKLAASDGCKK